MNAKRAIHAAALAAIVLSVAVPALAEGPVYRHILQGGPLRVHGAPARGSRGRAGNPRPAPRNVTCPGAGRSGAARR